MNPRERAAHRLAFVALAILAVPLAFRRIAGVDLPWHLAAGHEILSTGHVPRVDHWAILSAGRSWLDVHWLAQVLLAQLERSGGFLLLQLATVAFLLVTLFAVRAATPPGEGRGFVAPLLLAAMLASWQRIEPRPDVVSLLFPAILLVFFDRIHAAGTQGDWRKWVLPAAALEVLWVNLHGSYVLGIFLAAAAVLSCVLSRDERPALRPLLITSAAMSLATLVNPRGWTVWRLFHPYIDAIAARFGGSSSVAPPIQEWMPPLSAEARPYLTSILPWYLALLVLSALALVVPGRPLALRRAMALLMFVGLSLLALRNIAPFAFLAAAVLPAALAKSLGHFSERARSRFHLTMSLATATGALAMAGLFATNRYHVAYALASESGPGLQASAFPEAALAWVEAADLRGVPFHNYDMGGYWLWRFDRQRKALLDGRIDLIAPDQLARYTAAMADSVAFDRLAEELSVSYVVLSFTAGDARLLLAHLEQNPERWRRVFTDYTAVVYLRATAAVPQVRPVRKAEHPWDAWARTAFEPLQQWQTRLPVESLNLAILAQTLGIRSQAAEHYEQALRDLPGVPRWRIRLAWLYWELGDRERAMVHINWLRTHAPRDAAEAPSETQIQRDGNP